MRAVILLVLAIVALPLAAAEPDVRPLCDGNPLVDLDWCPDGFRLRTCGNDPSQGFTCYGIALGP